MIRTPDQLLRVFVSSTLEELAVERAAARAAIERLRLSPVMFELGARPHPPAELYRAYLDQSDVFVGIYWQRYGWVAPGETLSGLEDEFVRSTGMPRLMYIKEPADERDPRLAEMIGRLADIPDSSYRRFATPDELAELVQADLAILLAERFEASRPRRDDPMAGRPAAAAPAVPPVPLLATVGRDRETAALVSLVSSGARLVTITGPGGVGKTRLATDVARALLPVFDDVRVVPLADVDDPRLVAATIASGIGVSADRTQTPLDAVVAGIGADQVLLVLDNMEQVVDAGRDLTTLLERCPCLHLLVTSRRLLHLRGEREFPLAPLSLPELAVDGPAGSVEQLAAAPAVAMFVDHATAARPGFRLDASNGAAVAELCRRVDGIPLAIELVAARTRLLPPDVLLERFGDHLHLVPTSSADVPDRQRTLRATLEWSHRMLDPDERAVFALLGVFSGAAPLEAVEAVCGAGASDVIETLASLLDNSLVVITGDGTNGADVTMLPTVRAYALECLVASGGLAEARDRHAGWYRELAKRCDPAAGARATERWGTLAASLPNVRAAVTWLGERDDAAGLADIASSLWRWYWITGRVAEGRAWIGALWSRIPPASGTPDSLVTARLCTAVGAVRFSLGHHQRAEALLRRALTAFDVARDDAGVGQVAMMLAAVDALDGDHTGAIELATRAVAAARRLHLDWGLAQALTLLGSLLRHAGAEAAGRQLHLEALDTVRRVGEPVLEGQVLGHLALGELHAGGVDAAAAFLADAVRCCRPTHQLETTARLLEIGAAIAHADARPRDAVALDAAAAAIREQLGTPLWPAMRAERDALVAACAASLTDADLVAAVEEGRGAAPHELLGTLASARRELVAA